MTQSEAHAVYARRLPIYRHLALMPPLSHWRDRPTPFTWERSEVIRYIMRWDVDLEEARRIFNSAHKHGSNRNSFITFDSVTNRWQGTGVQPKTFVADSNHIFLREAQVGAKLEVGTDCSPVIRQEGRRMAKLHCAIMSRKISGFDSVLSSTSAGEGLRAYTEWNSARTQVAIARFNASASCQP